jgi:hypothetical protein
MLRVMVLRHPDSLVARDAHREDPGRNRGRTVHIWHSPPDAVSHGPGDLRGLGPPARGAFATATPRRRNEARASASSAEPAPMAMTSEGITGELFWGRTQQGSMAGDPADGFLGARFAVGGLHETLLEAYRKGDIDMIVEKAHPEIQTGVRDYVAQTGTLVNLHTKDDGRPCSTSCAEPLRPEHVRHDATTCMNLDGCRSSCQRSSCVPA